MRITKVCTQTFVTVTAIFCFASHHLQAQHDKPKLKIGTVLPLTGALAPSAVDLRQGMEFALEDIRREDPDVGSRVEIVIKDFATGTAKGGEVAKELMNSRQADLLIGPLTGSNTIAIYRALEGNPKPVISATATNPRITRLGDNVFRSCISDSDQGRILADFVFKDLKKTRASILSEESSEYSEAIATGFDAEFKALGGQVLARSEYKPGTEDFSTQLLALRRSNPQVVLVPGYYQDVSKIIDQSRRVGMKIPFIGGDGWDSPKLFQMTSKEAIRGHFFLSLFSNEDPDPAVKDFVTRFSAKYSRRPGTYAAMGYDAVYMVVDAFKRAKSNLASSLVRALASTKGARSLLGPISVSEQRDAIKGAVINITTPDGARFKARLTALSIEPQKTPVPSATP